MASRIPSLTGKFLKSTKPSNLVFGPTPNKRKPTDILDVYTQPVTFTFIDATATVILPFQLQDGNPIIQLKGLSVLSLSEHADAYPVTSLGEKGLNGFTRGHALTAGSFGFTIFDRDPWWDVIVKYDQWVGNDITKSITRPHNLPPFDLMINFINDRGDMADMTIRSVVLIDSSQSLGVDVIKMTQAYSFICKGVTTFVASTSNGNGVSTTPYYGFDLIERKPSTSILDVGDEYLDMRYDNPNYGQLGATPDDTTKPAKRPGTLSIDA